MKKQNLVLLLVAMFYGSEVRAEGSYMSDIAALGIVLVVLLFATGISYLLAVGANSILQSIRKEKRKHKWFQSLGILAFAGGFVWLDADENIVYQMIPYSWSEDAESIVYLAALVLLILIGAIIGYFITPVKKQKE